MCRKWVQHVNVAIAIVNKGKQWVPDKLQPDSYVAPTKGSNALTADLSYASRKSLNETSLEAQSPMAAHPTTAPQTLPRYTEPSESSHKIIMSPARAAAGTSLQAAGSRASYFDASLEDISRIPNAAGSSDGSSGPNSSPESQFSDPAMESRRSNSHQTISLNQSQSQEGTSVQPANLRSEFSSDRREASPERWQRPVSTERK